LSFQASESGDQLPLAPPINNINNLNMMVREREGGKNATSCGFPFCGGHHVVVCLVSENQCPLEVLTHHNQETMPFLSLNSLWRGEGSGTGLQ
jgi:hypothetical protein